MQLQRGNFSKDTRIFFKSITNCKGLIHGILCLYLMMSWNFFLARGKTFFSPNAHMTSYFTFIAVIVILGVFALKQDVRVQPGQLGTCNPSASASSELGLRYVPPPRARKLQFKSRYFCKYSQEGLNITIFIFKTFRQWTKTKDA